MGITAIGVSMISPHIKGADVLCLGYPDIFPRTLPYTPKIISRLERHGGGQCVDTEEFFEKMGAKSVRYIDIDDFYGKEDIVDLNHPQALGEYDLIIDPGTLEHCFNVGQAWKNIIEAVRLNGYIYHNNPVSMINHGFWNFSPTVYHDVYTQNGFECSFVLQQNGDPFSIDEVTKRLKVEPESQSQVLAKRTTMQQFKYPIQDKYLT